MKEVVSKFIATFGCETGYSGAQRIMYIKGERASEALREVREKWPTLAFYVRVTEEIPTASITESSVGVILETFQKEKKFVSASICINSDGTEEIREVFETSTTASSSKSEEEKEAEKILVTSIISSDASGFTDINDGWPTPASREEVDAYLLSNPIDRKAKGPYDKPASDLHVTVDYVRGRYRKLREKGLVEKESANA